MNYSSFEEHRKVFESVPQTQRAKFLQKLLETPQLPHQPPVIHYTPFPNESSFIYDQERLNYHYVESTQTPKAIVIYLHGLYCYGGNSGYLAVNICNTIEGVNFYSLDFLNCGKSTGNCRGYIRSFDDLVGQGQAFIDHLLSKFQKAPKIFLVGESLGGATVYKMSLLDPDRYAGVIFLNPALREIKESQYIMKKIGKFIGYLMPKLKLTRQSFTSTTKYNTQKIVKANPYLYNDRHIPGSVRVSLNAMEEIEKTYCEYKANYILFQGGVDKLVDVFAPLDLQKQCQSKDKTTIYLKDMWHSVFYEQQIKHITEMIIDWLAKRI